MRAVARRITATSGTGSTEGDLKGEIVGIVGGAANHKVVGDRICTSTACGGFRRLGELGRSFGDSGRYRAGRCDHVMRLRQPSVLDIYLDATRVDDLRRDASVPLVSEDSQIGVMMRVCLYGQDRTYSGSS